MAATAQIKKKVIVDQTYIKWLPPNNRTVQIRTLCVKMNNHWMDDPLQGLWLFFMRVKKSEMSITVGQSYYAIFYCTKSC